MEKVSTVFDYLTNIYMARNVPHPGRILSLNKRQTRYLALQNQINFYFPHNNLGEHWGEALILGLSAVAGMIKTLASVSSATPSSVCNWPKSGTVYRVR